MKNADARYQVKESHGSYDLSVAIDLTYEVQTNVLVIVRTNERTLL